MFSYVKFYGPPVLWAAFILWLCLLPGKDLPSISLWEIDKVAHFAFYFIWAVSLFYARHRLPNTPGLRQRAFLKILLLTITYGYAVEVLQELLTADRHYDALDATANATGAIAGTLVSRYWLFTQIR